MDFEPLQQFTDTMGDFLSTLNETFPEDEALTRKQEEFDTMVRPSKHVQDMLCRGYDKQMSPFYAQCHAHDAQPFIDGRVAMLEEMGFRQKYADLTDKSLYDDEEVMKENIENVWTFINKLNYYAVLYVSIPQGIMEEIVDMAQTLVQSSSDEQSGRLSINPMEVLRMSRNMIRNTGEDEIAELYNNLPSLLAMVSNSSVTKDAANAGVDIGQLVGILQSAASGAVPADGADGGDNAQGLLRLFNAMAGTVPGGATPTTPADLAAIIDAPAGEGPHAAPPGSSGDATSRRRAGWRPPGAHRQ